MNRGKYHELASELLTTILDEIGGKEHTKPEIFSEFGNFLHCFEDLVDEIHDDKRWPGRPSIARPVD
jgi:hypothetical protein